MVSCGVLGVLLVLTRSGWVSLFTGRPHMELPKSAATPEPGPGAPESGPAAPEPSPA